MVFASTLYSDPATGNEYVVAATKDKVILWNDANNSGINIDYPGSEVVATADGASFVQALEKLILFRGKNKTPLQWDGDVSNDFEEKANASPGSWTHTMSEHRLWCILSQSLNHPTTHR